MKIVDGAGREQRRAICPDLGSSRNQKSTQPPFAFTLSSYLNPQPRHTNFTNLFTQFFFLSIQDFE